MAEQTINMKRFGIIGAGSVGRTLAINLLEKEQLGYILVRNQERFKELVSLGIPANKIIFKLDDICKIPDVFIFAVNDSSLDKIVDEFSEIYGPVLIGKYIFHVSGSKTVNELLPLEKFNCKIFTAHPFQTFTIPSKGLLDGLIWGIEEGNTSRFEIEEILRALSGKCYFLSEASSMKKEQYHLTAVAASNFLISSLEFSKILFEKAGLDEPKLIEQIVKQSVENSLNNILNPDIFPISGPIARADSYTILRHLNTLKSEDELRKIYSHFSIATARLLHLRGKISQEEFEEILNTFTNY